MTGFDGTIDHNEYAYVFAPGTYPAGYSVPACLGYSNLQLSDNTHGPVALGDLPIPGPVCIPPGPCVPPPAPTPVPCRFVPRL